MKYVLTIPESFPHITAFNTGVPRHIISARACLHSLDNMVWVRLVGEHGVNFLRYNNDGFEMQYQENKDSLTQPLRPWDLYC
jgi:hypothetical protein